MSNTAFSLPFKAPFLKKWMWLVCFVFASNGIAGAAQTDVNIDVLTQQRQIFEQLESLVTQPNSNEYKRLKEQLGDYPLAPYIEQKTLLAFPYLANEEKIVQFLSRHEGTPLEWPLRVKWLNYLSKKNYRQRFLDSFKPTSNVELTCRYLHYRLMDDPKQPELLDQVTSLWLVGQSQPNECDPVFSIWTKAGYRTTEHVLTRLQLAGDGGNHTLIPYLKSLLPADRQYLADLWLKVRRAPSYVTNMSKFPGRTGDQELQILLYGLQRLIWRDEDLALKTWHAVSQRFTVSEQQQHEVARQFALALAIDDHDKAEEWLERANNLDADEELFRWHLAHVLRQQNWQHAIDIIELAPDSIRNENSFQYWQGRAYEQVNATEFAQKQFSKLAKKRHYYGFLASGKLAQHPTIYDKPLEFEPSQLQEVAALPGAQRAYEFLQLGRYRDARREWLTLQPQLSVEQKLISAVLADSWQWHDQAIFGFANAGYLDDVKRRFPLAFSNELVTGSHNHQIDPAWAFAIARRESSFMHDANSSAGAKGLMQLLPGTARYLAQKKIKSSSLFDPVVNVDFGTQYLRYLLDKMDNNPVLATASYNAGWRKVQSWIPSAHSMPADIWIETIPYKETRNYVKAVLAYRQIYAEQLGSPISLFEDLANMELKADTPTVQIN